MKQLFLYFFSILYGLISCKYCAQAASLRNNILDKSQIPYDGTKAEKINRGRGIILVLVGAVAILLASPLLKFDLGLIRVAEKTLCSVLSIIIGIDVASYIILFAYPKIYKNNFLLIVSIYLLACLVMSLFDVCK